MLILLYNLDHNSKIRATLTTQSSIETSALYQEAARKKESVTAPVCMDMTDDFFVFKIRLEKYFQL